MGNAIKHTWIVEASHMVAVPQEYCAYSLKDLIKQVQETADSKRCDPPMGDISFRYELDDDLIPVVAHTYFINKRGKQARFMRLRRKP